MTAEEFLQKFPNAEENENCLTDMACPVCGRRDRFMIEVRATAYVTDDGTESTDGGDQEWDETSYYACANLKCPFSGKVRDVTIAGLDDLISERQDKKG